MHMSFLQPFILFSGGGHQSLGSACGPGGDQGCEVRLVIILRLNILNNNHVRLPQQLQRAMAAEAEATREARAKVIAAEGEQKSSKALKEAADIIAMSPAALQLRYLQV